MPRKGRAGIFDPGWVELRGGDSAFGGEEGKSLSAFRENQMGSGFSAGLMDGRADVTVRIRLQ
jgi:hypothetical protein